MTSGSMPAAHNLVSVLTTLVFSAGFWTGAGAADAAPFSSYRGMLGEDNPAELAVARGEELWQTPRGPARVTLATCDLGLGPGVLRGAYASLPRYFAVVAPGMDLEPPQVYFLVGIQRVA